MLYNNKPKRKIKKIDLPHLSENLFIFNNIECHLLSVLAVICVKETIHKKLKAKIP